MGTSTDPEPKCPVCSRNDRAARVSALYFASLNQKYSGKNRSELNPTENFQTAFNTDPITSSELSEKQLAELAIRLAPPAGSKRGSHRPLHPDMVIGLFTLIAPVFIFGMLTSQPQMLPYTIPCLVGLYIFYFWRRSELVAKHSAQIEAQRSAEEKVRRGVERWMMLRCCTRCDVVFLPGKPPLEVERMQELLLS